MSWRVVVISNRSKLDYKLGSLVVRSEDGEKRIHLGDISVLMVESTAVSLTAYLLAELTARKIKIIFCDNQHNPVSELVPSQGNSISSGRIRSQIAWPQEHKRRVWQNIIQQKIAHQATVLNHVGKPEKAQQLLRYVPEVRPGDTTNREGHAAKVYFNALFGMEFSRGINDVRNAILNYGYAILLACLNREIAANGYLTQLGIWHDNASNPFNLGSDLMEPYRPIVDRFAYDHRDLTEFDSEEKHQVLNLLNQKIQIGGSEQFLNNAIGLYARSIFNALEEGKFDKILSWHEL